MQRVAPLPQAYETRSDRPERWPDFFLVGAPRSGTTSMFTYLKQHPEVYVSVHKEPHFFGSDLSIQPHTVRDREVYLSLFVDARDDQRVGEGSVWYLRSTQAAREISTQCIDAKIIIMLRDPIEMIRSLHSLYLRTGNEDLHELTAAINAQDDRRAGRRIPSNAYFPEGLLYTEATCYHKGVRRYLDVFGPRQVKILIFEDYAADPAAVYRETLRFLQIDPTFVPTWDLPTANRQMRPAVLRQLRRLGQVCPDLLTVMRGRGQQHLGPKAPLDQALRARLRERLAGDVAELSMLLDRDLSHWCRP
ncbi:MAG: sulfotransferase domain-containing protein [Myxococcota bacterium]